MSVLTKRQRDVLQRRIERAICWRKVPSSYRDDARRLALAVLDEIDECGMDGPAATRAVARIADRLEEAS